MRTPIDVPGRTSARRGAPIAGTTRYVRSGAGHVAFQVLGAGRGDILVVNESVLPLEALHDNVHTASFLAHLASWGRVIVFDRRGVGLSDPATPGLSLDDWVGDATAVLDAVGSARAAVMSFGPSAGLIALRLAATCPERVSFLSLYDAIARYLWAPDHPWGVTDDVAQRIAERMRGDWGTARFADRRGRFAATAALHPGFVDWAITWFRRGAGPASLAAHEEVLRGADVRAGLAAIRCPTVVFNHAGVDDGPFLAASIEGARYVELQNPCHVLFSPDLDELVAVTGAVLGSGPAAPASRRVLTTVVVTDVVESAGTVVRGADADPLGAPHHAVRGARGHGGRRRSHGDVRRRDPCRAVRHGGVR
jgi:pimeloyl-ACP methyl ester carboxylesterase